MSSNSGKKKSTSPYSPKKKSPECYLKSRLNQLETRSKPRVEPKNWVLNNKELFPKWVSTEFKKYSDEEFKKLYETSEKEACDVSNRDKAFKLFPHQMFIRDYLQHDSPYRGLLLYHGLGVGKTCSSIAVAEILLNFKKVIVILPASLRNNYISELKKCGNQMYNNMTTWKFYSKAKHSDVSLFHSKYDIVPKIVIEKNNGIWLPNKDKFDSRCYENNSQAYVSEEVFKNNLIKDLVELKRLIKTIKNFEEFNKINSILDLTNSLGSPMHTVLQLMNGFVNIKKELMDFVTKYRKKDDAAWDEDDGMSRDDKNTLKNIIKIVDKTKYSKTTANDIWKETSKWVNNIKVIAQRDQKQLSTQIEKTIHHNYEFVHYDGLRSTNIKNLTKPRMYDNKVIVIDEVHNFMLGVSNQGFKPRLYKKSELEQLPLKSQLYSSLMNAKNSKLVLLSGTPIINSPHEIAYTMNLLRGKVPTYVYELKGIIKKEDVNKIFEKNPYIDTHNVIYAANTSRIEFQLVPTGFKKSRGKLVTDDDKTFNLNNATKVNTMLNKLAKELKKVNGVEVTNNYVESVNFPMLMPTDEAEFSGVYVNNQKAVIKNERIFANRINGLVSHFTMDNANKSLMPRKLGIKREVLSYSNTQLQEYVTQRNKEIQKEKLSKLYSKKSTTETGVFKIFSRLACNFVFPSSVPRPWASMKKMNEVEQTDADFGTSDKKKKDTTTTDNSKNDDDGKDEIPQDEMEELDKDLAKYKENDNTYQQRIAECLELLDKNRDEFLKVNLIDKKKDEEDKLSPLHEYSPKFCRIIKNIHFEHGSEGNILIYSNFRSVEGINVLGIALKANGYGEIVIKPDEDSKTKELNIQIDKKDIDKPKFIKYSGKDTNIANIILHMYNNEFDKLPTNVQKTLKRLGLYDNGNLRGELVKVLMITQSGAEGISLKNVRQVHIVEPYWNRIRIDQVIGRADRTCSHIELPENERDFQTFEYFMTLKDANLAKNAPVKDVDKSNSTDEIMYDLSLKKKQLNDSFINVLKKASIDCNIFKSFHPERQCQGDKVDKDTPLDKLAYEYHYKDDYVYVDEVEQVTIKVQRVSIKGEMFYYLMDTNELIDYDIYNNQKITEHIGYLLKLGDSSKFLFKRLIK